MTKNALIRFDSKEDLTTLISDRTMDRKADYMIVIRDRVTHELKSQRKISMEEFFNYIHIMYTGEAWSFVDKTYY